MLQDKVINKYICCLLNIEKVENYFNNSYTCWWIGGD